MATEHDEDAKLREVVVKYIEATKKWPTNDYSLRKIRSEEGIVVFLVAHKDDETISSPGGGKSIMVHVDTHTMEVSREFRFQ